MRVVPGLVPCDHLVDLKAQVGLTDLVGLVVMVGLVTILKDCLESIWHYMGAQLFLVFLLVFFSIVKLLS